MAFSGNKYVTWTVDGADHPLGLVLRFEKDYATPAKGGASDGTVRVGR